MCDLQVGLTQGLGVTAGHSSPFAFASRWLHALDFCQCSPVGLPPGHLASRVLTCLHACMLCLWCRAVTTPSPRERQAHGRRKSVACRSKHAYATASRCLTLETSALYL